MNTIRALTLRATISLAAALSLAPPPLSAYDQSFFKIHATNALPQSSPSFGFGVAANDRWIAVCESGNQDKGTLAGAVHVFNAVTRAWTRKLTAPDGVANDRFGSSVSVWGDIAVIGASGATGNVSHSGVAYVFNLRTGAFLRKLVPSVGSNGGHFGSSVAVFGSRALVGAPDTSGAGLAFVFDVNSGTELHVLTPLGASGDEFGASVALDGTLALVGAPQATGMAAHSGKAYLYDAVLGVILQDFKADDGVTNDSFGSSVALDRGLVLVGAPLVSKFVQSTGAAYLFYASNGFQIKKIEAADSATSQFFGVCVALSGGLALIGADGDGDMGASAGAAYGFDATEGTQLYKVLAPDGAAGDHFGRFLAISRNTAVIGAYDDKDLGPNSGSAYIVGSVSGPMTFDRVAQAKDFAPGTLGAVLSSLGEPVTNSNGYSVFTAVLSGQGVSLANNRGLWDDLAPGQALDLVVRKGDHLGSVDASGATNPILNHPSACIFEASYTGVGVNAGNNRSILRDDGSTLLQLVRLGDTPAALGGARLSGFSQIAQSYGASYGQVAAVRLALGTGVSKVTSASDSGLLFVNDAGTVLGAIREGAVSPAGDPYGQISRVGYHSDQADFVAGIQSEASTNQGVFRVTANGATSRLVARKGSLAPGTGGLLFSSFVDSTDVGTGEALFLATLKGAGVTLGNNQGLWREHLGTVSLVARTGTFVSGGSGPVWSRFLRYWPTYYAGGQVMVLATLRGAGVTAANDRALMLLQEDGTWLQLLREGDAVPGCNSATVGTIQTVVAENQMYAVWVTLAGVPASSNQALLTGRTDYPLISRALRLPHLRLRKGNIYSSAGTSAPLAGVSVPQRSVDSTGAGAKGIGSPLSAGSLSLTLRYTDGTVQIVNGTLW